jgi:RIO kinase 1
MASKVSKRKKPPKEEYQLKERFKIESDVFDRQTLLVLSKIIKKGVIETVEYPISTGKEANVFLAITPSGERLAIKIYKIETSHFFRKAEYLEGDPRFEKIKHTDRAIVEAFARKEFKNLEIAQKAKVHAPRPLYVLKHVLVMTFLGEENLPYPTMDMVGPRTEADLDSILQDIKNMYKAGLVHADLSEYNIMLGKVPFLIDFGQGVVLEHMSAKKFLERDVSIILKYFKKHGVKRDFEKVMDWIKEE